MAVINKPTNQVLVRMWKESGTLLHCWWEYQLVKPLWKAVWSYLKILKMELPYNPAIPLLGIYPKKPKTLIWKNICSSVFAAALWSSPDVHQMSGLKSCGTFTQWNTTQPLKRKSYLLQFCNSMDGSGEYYAEWNKPVRERQIPYAFTYMWNLMNKIK